MFIVGASLLVGTVVGVAPASPLYFCFFLVAAVPLFLHLLSLSVFSVPVLVPFMAPFFSF